MQPTQPFPLSSPPVRWLVWVLLLATVQQLSAQGSITVTYPNGGEELMIGTETQVTWTASGITGEVEVEYTVDGAQWRGIGKANATQGSIEWKIPNKESAIVRVRVSERKGSASDQSDGTFAIIPDPLDATIMIAPNGGEQWAEGETRAIQWQVPPDAVEALIELSTNNGATWQTIATQPATPATYSWAIPHLSDSPITACLMRVSVAQEPDHVDVSDAPFTISPKQQNPPPPAGSITVRFPNGGERFAADTSVVVTWQATNVAGKAVIEYSANGGGQWSGIGSVDAATGAFLWRVPNNSGSQYLVRVMNEGRTVGDTSDAQFSVVTTPITPPDTVITTRVLTPNGGETWREGEVQQIAWQTPKEATEVVVDISTDGGNSWTQIARQPAATGAFQWRVPRLADSTISVARIKVSVASQPDLADQSNGSFTILPKPPVNPTLGVELADGVVAGGIFPNPASQLITVRWNGAALLPATIRIAAIDGTEVMAVPAQPQLADVAEQSIAIGRLPNGIYICEIHSGGQPRRMMFTVAR